MCSILTLMAITAPDDVNIVYKIDKIAVFNTVLASYLCYVKTKYNLIKT